MREQTGEMKLDWRQIGNLTIWTLSHFNYPKCSVPYSCTACPQLLRGQCRDTWEDGKGLDLEQDRPGHNSQLDAAQLIYREKVKRGEGDKAIGLSHVLGTKWRLPRHEEPNQRGLRPSRMEKGRYYSGSKFSEERMGYLSPLKLLKWDAQL